MAENTIVHYVVRIGTKQHGPFLTERDAMNYKTSLQLTEQEMQNVVVIPMNGNDQFLTE